MRNRHIQHKSVEDWSYFYFEAVISPSEAKDKPHWLEKTDDSFSSTKRHGLIRPLHRKHNRKDNK